MARARVAVVPTGGTIDSVGRDRLDMAWYIEHRIRLDDAEMLARVPELDQIAGGFFAHNYPAGAGLTRGAVFGRICGVNAAAHAERSAAAA